MICESAVEISRGDVRVILGEENGSREACKPLGNQLGSLPLTPSSNRKGLQNRLGENNCFLNSVVQVLWRLDPFRKSFLLVSGHACTEKSCIFCALKVVFTQFQFSDRSTLPPDSLRRALAMAFAKRSRFQLGLMDDATECFEIILRWLHFHLVYNEPFDRCNAQHCISHSKFGMNITEQSFCILCGTKTRPLTFTELVHYVPTSAISRQQSCSSRNGNRTRFGRLLKTAVDNEGRSCSAGCGEGLQLTQALTNSPDVLTIGLVWDSDNATPNEIAQLVRSIENTIRPSDLFQSSSLSVEFRLVGVVCYYRKHYSTFLYDEQERVWNLYDDATIVQVGRSWSVVVAKICVGRFQPLLLFYENPESQPVSMVTAPLTTSFVDVPANFASFSHGGSLTDLTSSLKRHVADYDGGNPSIAQRKSFSSNLEDAHALPENSSLPAESVPILVTHHSSRDTSQSEDRNPNCSSRVKGQSAIVTNSDPHPEISGSATRLGQEGCPVSFAESRSSHTNSPCTKASSGSSLGCGVWTDSLKKNKSFTKGAGDPKSDFDRCFWARSKFLPSFHYGSAQMFFGDGSDFAACDLRPADTLRNKRSSFAFSSQNSFELSEPSYYSSDDQFLSLGSRLSAGRFPLSQGFFPRWSSSSIPFGSTRISRNSEVIDDAEDAQESYINPETVLNVLRSRGLKLVHPGSGLHGKKHDDATVSKSPSEQMNNLSIQLQVTHITSDGNSDSCNNSNVKSSTTLTSNSPKEINSRFVTTPESANRPEIKRQQKGILTNRKQKKKKRVSFSDNVALVLCADDSVPQPKAQNYVDYVQQIATRNHSLRSSSLSSTSSSDSSYSSMSDSTVGSTTSPLPDLPGSLAEGAVSGFPEEDDGDTVDSEDDACIPEENLDGNPSSDKIRCNLCCRKWIVAPDVYCRDCNVYLNRLQHRT